jgi:hypothetical protein
VGELVDDVEHSIFTAIMSAILDEVVGPDVVRMLGPETDAGTVRHPQSATFWLLLRDLQALAPPDPFNPAITDRPASLAQQGGDLTVAVAAILTGQLGDIGCQPFGILSAPRGFALRRAVLPERRTGAALGDVQMRSDLLDASATARGA